jgi:hypothetical protein
MSNDERDDVTPEADEDTEAHASHVRDASKVRNADEETDDVEGHSSHVREASHVRNADGDDDVEGHVSRTR